MKNSQKKFKEEFIERVLAILWKQWTALGIAGGGNVEKALIIDSEALLLLSMTAGRFDARLFDEVIDWLETNGRFISIARLKNIAGKFDFKGLPQFTAIANILSRDSSLQMKWRTLKTTKSTGHQKEPFFLFPDGKKMPLKENSDPDFFKAGFLRLPVETRGLSRLFPNDRLSNGMLKCRALFGINVRSDLFCLLAAIPEIHPAKAAKLLSFQSKTVQEELNSIEMSGVLSVREDGRKKLFSLNENFAEAVLPMDGRQKVRWLNMPAIFRAIEEALLFFPNAPDTVELHEKIKLNRLRNELFSIISKGERDFMPRIASSSESHEILEILLSALEANQLP